MNSSVKYISLGMDCSVAYNLKVLKLDSYYYIFDWSYIPKLTDIIDIINNCNIYNILLNSNNYNYIKLNFKNHFYNDTNIATHKLSHKLYKLEFNHEISNISTFDNFVSKYIRRINRFFELKTSTDQLIFIRLGTNKDLKYLKKLKQILQKIFNENIKLLFINSSKYTYTTSWKREELNWAHIINDLNNYID